jgi:hypothetical protein
VGARATSRTRRCPRCEWSGLSHGSSGHEWRRSRSLVARSARGSTTGNSRIRAAHRTGPAVV